MKYFFPERFTFQTFFLTSSLLMICLITTMNFGMSIENALNNVSKSVENLNNKIIGKEGIEITPEENLNFIFRLKTLRQEIQNSRDNTQLTSLLNEVDKLLKEVKLEIKSATTIEQLKALHPVISTSEYTDILSQVFQALELKINEIPHNNLLRENIQKLRDQSSYLNTFYEMELLALSPSQTSQKGASSFDESNQKISDLILRLIARRSDLYESDLDVVIKNISPGIENLKSYFKEVNASLEKSFNYLTSLSKSIEKSSAATAEKKVAFDQQLNQFFEIVLQVYIQTIFLGTFVQTENQYNTLQNQLEQMGNYVINAPLFMKEEAFNEALSASSMLVQMVGTKEKPGTILSILELLSIKPSNRPSDKKNESLRYIGQLKNKIDTNKLLNTIIMKEALDYMKERIQKSK